MIRYLFILLLTSIIACESSSRYRIDENKNGALRKQLIENIEDGISLIDETDKNLKKILKDLQDARKTAYKGSVGLYDFHGRRILNTEFLTLLDNASLEIKFADYNDIPILNSLNKNWQKTIPITVSDKSKALNIRMPGLTPSLFGIYSSRNLIKFMKTEGRKNSYSFFKDKDLHLKSADDSEKTAKRLEDVIYRVLREQARMKAYSDRLNYSKKIQECLLENNDDKMKNLVKFIERELLILATKSANGTNTDKRRILIQFKFGQLRDELLRIEREYKIKSEFTFEKNDHIKNRENAERLRLQLINLSKNE